MVLIHEKITALLEQRRLKKRDLARALSVSPQTATDICKGRSAITLPHLRNLISFFDVRADFWLDDEKLAPTETDRPQRRAAADQLVEIGMLQIEDPAHLMECVRSFIKQNQDHFLALTPDVTAAERTLLGLPEQTLGVAASDSAPAAVTSAAVTPAAVIPAAVIPAIPPVSAENPAETPAGNPAGNPAGTSGTQEVEFDGE